MAWQSSTPRLPGYVAGVIRGRRHVKILNRFAAKVKAREVAQATAVDWTKYRDNVAQFALDMFGVVLWERQAEIAHAVEVHSRVAVKSGHKIGKSRLVAVVAWWWACTRQHGQVYMTSASWTQVVETLWPEVRLLWSLASERGHRLSPSAPPLDGGTGVRWPDGRKIIAFSTNTPERAAGFSGPEMLFELDECSGISREIYEAIMGNTMGGAKELLTGNPTEAAGILYDAFTEKAHLYSTHTISSEETPNASSPDQSTWIPGLADRAKIDELLGEYGSDSPFADVRIHGNFPRQGQNSVIGLAEVEAAQVRHRLPPEPGWRRLRVGVDVARYGDDDSVIYGVRGPRSLEPVVAHGQDTQAIAALVFKFVQDELTRAGGFEQERPIVRVDEIGVGGGVVDRLRSLLSEHAARHSGQALFLLEGINVSRVAMDPERYALARDEAWFAARDWLRAGGTLPTDGRLAGELSGILYKLDPRGRYQVESKDETKRRLKRSPDRADALCLAVYGREHSEPLVVSAGARTTPQYSAPQASGLGRGRNIWGK